jgi:cytochrome c oxidase subunit II
VSVMRMPYARSLGMLAVAAVLVSHRLATAATPVHEIQIVASKFQFTPSTIQVTSGESVRLIIQSTDTVHGFSIPKLKLDTRIPKGGEPVTVEFVAPPAGQYEIACSEFCGIGHGQMKAMLVSTSTTQLLR